MKKMLLSGVLVSIGIFFGRLSGFFREILIATKLGANEETDLVIVFLTTPDVLVSLLVGGALGMALIPEFKSLKNEHANALYRQVILIFGLLFFLVTVILYFLSEKFLKILAPGMSNDLLLENISYFSISLLAIPFAVLAGVTTAYLHYKNKFFIPSLGTLIFNLVIIFSLYFIVTKDSSELFLIISISILTASFARWVSQVLNSKKWPFTSSFNFFLINKELLARYFYCLLTGGFVFLLPVFIRAAASSQGEGVLSLVNYAIKLVEFPLGVVLTIFSIVFFPKFSELYISNKRQQFEDNFKFVFTLVLCFAIAMLVPLYTFSANAVDMVFGWGALEANQLSGIEDYLNVLILTLPFQGLNALLISTCAARKDVVIPLLITSFSVIAFVIYSNVIENSFSSVLRVVIITYALITFSLIVNLMTRHGMKFFYSISFNIDIIKIISIGVLYYIALSAIEVNNSVGVVIISSVSAVLYIACSLMVGNKHKLLLRALRNNEA